MINIRRIGYCGIKHGRYIRHSICQARRIVRCGERLYPAHDSQYLNRRLTRGLTLLPITAASVHHRAITGRPFPVHAAWAGQGLLCGSHAAATALVRQASSSRRAGQGVFTLKIHQHYTFTMSPTTRWRSQTCSTMKM